MTYICPGFTKFQLLEFDSVRGRVRVVVELRMSEDAKIKRGLGYPYDRGLFNELEVGVVKTLSFCESHTLLNCN